MEILKDKCKKIWFNTETRKKIRRNGELFSEEECKIINDSVFWLNQKKDNIKEKVMYIAHEITSPLKCPITNKEIKLKNPLYRTYSDEMIKNRCFISPEKIKIRLQEPFYENYSKTDIESIITTINNNVAIRYPMVINHCWVSLKDKGFNLSEISSNEEAFYLYTKKLNEIPKCPISGQNRKFFIRGMKYFEYSSTNSAKKASSILHTGKKISETTKDKRKSTMIERYGISCMFKLKSNYEKALSVRIKNSFLKKEEKEKNKDNRTRKEKWMDSIKKKYNVSSYKEYHNLYQKDSHEKAQITLRATLKRKYGVDKISDIPNVKEKIKSTNIKKYGATCFINSSKQQDKRRLQSKMDTYHNFSRFEKECIPMFTLSEWLIGYDTKLPWKKISTGEIFHCKYWGYAPVGKFKYSSLEQSVCSMLDSLGVYYIRNSRDIISPNELDIYIPSHKLAIECNGEYFHSSRTKPIYYHLEKMKKCEDGEIRLINLFGKTISDDSKKLYSFLRSIIKGNKIRIPARKCSVIEISNAIAKPFIEKYHLQGFHRGKKHYGLFFKSRLISVISVGKARFSKKETDVEILRYVNMNNVYIIGGFKKILSHIKKDFCGRLLHTYSDMNMFTGRVYENNGFSFIRETPPDFYYYKDKNNSYSRYQTQKHKLSDLLGADFNPNETEEQNMNRMGYYRVYGCGHKYFTLKL